jgi:hypothetical protein
MTLFIIDANIFIDLIKNKWLDSFFSLDMDVGTTHAVLNELHTWQQDVLNDYIQLKKLQIFPIEEAGYRKKKLVHSKQVSLSGISIS